MTREEIDGLLKHYSKIRQAVEAKSQFAEISGYRKRIVLAIDEKIRNLVSLLAKLKERIQDEEVLTLFNLCYEEGMKDRSVMNKLHMSESTFYRIKEKLHVKLWLLCAVNHLITEEEILKIEII